MKVGTRGIYSWLTADNTECQEIVTLSAKTRRQYIVEGSFGLMGATKEKIIEMHQFQPFTEDIKRMAVYTAVQPPEEEKAKRLKDAEYMSFFIDTCWKTATILAALGLGYLVATGVQAFAEFWGINIMP